MTDSEHIDALKKVAPHLASRLSDERVRQVLSVTGTHKAQPVARLVRAATRDFEFDRLTLLNTDTAIKWATRNEGIRTWLDRKISTACNESAFENSAAALAEVRALGALLEAGFEVEPLSESRDPTPEFEVSAGGEKVRVEVHCKQMNGEEAERLAKFYASTSERPAKGNVNVTTHIAHPGGRPRQGENVGQNVAHKFASIKAGARQAEGPSILWLDLQDEDWWAIGRDYAHPLISAHDALMTGPLWAGLYGRRSTPILEGAFAERTTTGRPALRMGFPGLFQQSAGWSAAILAFPRDTLILENPDPSAGIPLSIAPELLSLPWVRFEHSWMQWPHQTNRSLRQRIAEAHRRLRGAASRSHVL
ncbi:MAG: hypothetical protein KDB53_09855 [Planctomycetes bacterium]|nr:hypothetical protein [Planctomycetota bacterium]